MSGVTDGRSVGWPPLYLFIILVYCCFLSITDEQSQADTEQEERLSLFAAVALTCAFHLLKCSLGSGLCILEAAAVSVV